MEDGSSDESREGALSPKLGGKKLKMNDGSCQESAQDAASSSKREKEDNSDTGVSMDKSESTSSENREDAAAQGPSNEVVNVAPSTSNVQAILLNVRRSRKGRNYRRIRTPELDTDSDSSKDSDDGSGDEAPVPRWRNAENSNDENENIDDDHSYDMRFEDIVQRFTTATDSDGSEMQTAVSSDEQSSGSDSDDLSNLAADMVPDSDSEDGAFSRHEDDGEGEGSKGKTPPVLLKTRPQHNYVLLKELINREMGMTVPSGRAAKTDLLFESRFYGSLNTVYRLRKMHSLNKHRGCVNSINFHPEGELLASGSDDQNVIVWNWARKVPLQTIKTGHKANVFQSKFLYLNARSQLNIVTCARDGQVRLLQCPPSGGAASRRRLASHSKAAHKLHVMPSEPHLVISAGEDALLMQCDVRADRADRLFQVKENGRLVPLYSVHGHPLDSKLLCVAGRDRFVRVYDRRRCARPLAAYCPGAFQDDVNVQKKRLTLSMMHVTCAVYNHDGTEILGSYNDEDIYLFNTKDDVFDKDSTKDGFTHRYSGHRNNATYKGVSFFGPASEYVVSGSDCSNIYIWDKKSEAIVQWARGDNGGVVNCIDTHPRSPIMATSGLDKDVKIWLPMGYEPDNHPEYSGLERVVRENGTSQLRSPLFNDFLPTLYSAWRGGASTPTQDSANFGGNIEFDGNVCTAF